MPQALVYTSITCPYCYSSTSTEIDISADTRKQQYYEDCETCCAPMELTILIDEQGEIDQIEVRRGNG